MIDRVRMSARVSRCVSPSSALAAVFTAALATVFVVVLRRIRLFLHDFHHLPLVRGTAAVQAGFLALVLLAAASAARADIRINESRYSDGKTIVAILPDSGERYLSGPLFEGLFDETGLPRI